MNLPDQMTNLERVESVIDAVPDTVLPFDRRKAAKRGLRETINFLAKFMLDLEPLFKKDDDGKQAEGIGK